jgi:hypothetical protein
VSTNPPSGPLFGVAAAPDETAGGDALDDAVPIEGPLLPPNPNQTLAAAPASNTPPRYASRLRRARRRASLISASGSGRSTGGSCGGLGGAATLIAG